MLGMFMFRKNLKGIVSPDGKGLQMVSLDRFEVLRVSALCLFLI
jgi:hypothetical protein